MDKAQRVAAGPNGTVFIVEFQTELSDPSKKKDAVAGRDSSVVTPRMTQDIIFRGADGSGTGFDIRLGNTEDRSMDQQFPHRLTEGAGHSFGQPMRQDTGRYEMDSAEIPVALPAKNSPFPSSRGAVQEWKALYRDFWLKDFNLALELASFARYE